MIDVKQIPDEELVKEYEKRWTIKISQAEIQREEEKIKLAEEKIAELRERIRVLKD